MSAPLTRYESGLLDLAVSSYVGVRSRCLTAALNQVLFDVHVTGNITFEGFMVSQAATATADCTTVSEVAAKRSRAIAEYGALLQQLATDVNDHGSTVPPGLTQYGSITDVGRATTELSEAVWQSQIEGCVQTALNRFTATVRRSGSVTVDHSSVRQTATASIRNCILEQSVNTSSPFPKTVRELLTQYAQAVPYPNAATVLGARVQCSAQKQWMVALAAASVVAVLFLLALVV